MWNHYKLEEFEERRLLSDLKFSTYRNFIVWLNENIGSEIENFVSAAESGTIDRRPVASRTYLSPMYSADFISKSDHQRRHYRICTLPEFCLFFFFTLLDFFHLY